MGFCVGAWTYLARKDVRTAPEYIPDSIQAYQEVGSTRDTGITMNGCAALEAVKGDSDQDIEIAIQPGSSLKRKVLLLNLG